MDPELRAAFDGINARFDGIDKRLDSIANRLETVSVVSRMSQNEHAARLAQTTLDMTLADQQRWLDFDRRLTKLERAVSELQHQPSLVATDIP